MCSEFTTVVLGGIAGLVISILAKIQEYRDRGKVSRTIYSFLSLSHES